MTTDWLEGKMLSEEQIGLLWSKWVATGKGGLELIKMTEQALLTPLDDEKIVKRMAHWMQEHTDFACNLKWEQFDEDAQDNFRLRAESLYREIAPSIKESGRREERKEICKKLTDAGYFENYGEFFEALF